jgi:hypothetical protein
MIKISHRGNLYGPNKELENSPEYIIQAINSGYNVEIDFWVVDNLLYLGHDYPQYKIDQFFLDSYIKKIWLHCKNLDALSYVVNKPKYYKGFWHENDKYTITTNHYIWTYPGMPVTNKSILVHLNRPENNIPDFIAGICSDYVGLI